VTESLLKLKSADIKYMMNDTGFRSYASKAKVNLDKIDAKRMHNLFFRYLKATNR